MSTMRKSRSRQLLGGAAGAVLLASGAGALYGPALAGTISADAEPLALPAGTVHEVDGYNMSASRLVEDGDDYVRKASVESEFVFDQEGVTPSDELFNVFGTAILSMCSKPAVEIMPDAEGTAIHYVNVGGATQESFSVDLKDLADQSTETLVGCSCMTGSPFGQARVVGIPLSVIVGVADLEEGVNTLTAYGADGYGEPLPLRYAFEKNALLVYEVNGERLASKYGPSAQLWVPETVAHYFTRNVMDIELSREDAPPEVQGVDATYRNKINILNGSDGCEFKAGDEISFEGVADDMGSPVTGIEFTLDDGATWTAYGVEDATPDKWVNWSLKTTFDEAGDYRLQVRAKTADGVVSPISAELAFSVVA